MARRLLAVVAVSVASAGVAPATGMNLPFLRSASVSARHVVLLLAVDDVRPVQLTVAKRSDVGAGGALLASNVVRQETIRLVPGSSTGVVRWKSRMTLAPGAYFVQVKAVESGGLTDCPPKLMRTCLDRWSNIRRIVVPSSG